MNDKYFKWGVSLIVLACVAYGGYVWYWWEASMESKGQLGDSFGAVTSLFTVLTFFYFVHTVDLQQKQLALQKDDFKLQLEELISTREELAKQSKAQQESQIAFNDQTQIQALTALINVETAMLNLYESNYQEARERGHLIDMPKYSKEVASTIVKINTYRKILTDKLEKSMS